MKNHPIFDAFVVIYLVVGATLPADVTLRLICGVVLVLMGIVSIIERTVLLRLLAEYREAKP